MTKRDGHLQSACATISASAVIILHSVVMSAHTLVCNYRLSSGIPVPPPSSPPNPPFPSPISTPLKSPLSFPA